MESDNHTSAEDSKVDNKNNNSTPFGSIYECAAVDHNDPLMFDRLKDDICAPALQTDYATSQHQITIKSVL